MSCFHQFIKSVFFTVVITFSAVVGSTASALPTGVRAVNAAATGTNTGLTWTNAYTTLQDALADPNATEIWIAAGTYRPDQGGGNTPNSRNASFVLVKGVKIYGGFIGGVNGETAVTQRNWRMNTVLLTGEINNLTTTSDNSHHVVKVSNATIPAMDPATTLLDGVSIAYGLSLSGEDDGGAGIRCETGGDAMFRNCTVAHNKTEIGSLLGSAYGGGIRVSNASPVFINCVIRNNETGNGAGYGGGVVVRNDSDPQFIACTFRSNRAGHGGGLAVKNSANVQLLNCLIEGNSILTSGSGSQLWGGGVAVDRSGSAQIVNCTFALNTAVRGGAYAQFSNTSQYNSTIDNCIFWGNTATASGHQIYLDDLGTQLAVRHTDLQGGSAGIGGSGTPSVYTNNVNVDPLFVDGTVGGNFRLRCGSPVRNVASNGFVPCDL